MKLRDASIRLTLDDWIAGSGGLEYRYDTMTYWYGSSIFIVMQKHERIGVHINARNTGMGLPAYWPDPYLLSVDHLRQLDAAIAACRHEEIITILIAFKRKMCA